MGDVVRGTAFRARENRRAPRTNRFVWFALATAVNIFLWAVLITLILRAV